MCVFGHLETLSLTKFTCGRFKRRVVASFGLLFGNLRFTKMEKQLLANAPLSVLNKLGYLSPISLKNVWLKMAVIILFIFVFVVAFMQCFYVETGIFGIVDNVVLMVGDFQMLCKIILIMINRNKISNLIELRDSFWDSDKCTKNTKNTIDRISFWVTTMQKSFLYCALSICLLSHTLMYFTGNKLPFGSWSMSEYTRLYTAAAPAYSVCIFTMCVCCYCFEGIFIGLCYEIVVQYMILSVHLERMNVENIESQEDLDAFYSQLKVYIEHHRFLRSYTNLFQDYFSAFFMVDYVTAIPLICSLFYVTFESPNLALTFRYGATCFVCILRLSFYCISLATLSEEVTSVSTAIYNSNWYSKHYMKLKKSTLLIIQQAQQEIRFTAWGLVDMNPGTLVDVLKLAFSTSTFLRSLD